VRALLAALLGLAPVIAFAQAFAGLRDGRYLLPTAGAVLVAAAAILLLSMVKRLVPAARALAGLAMLVLYIGVVLAPGPSWLSGPRRLVTSALPLDPAGPELAAVAAFCGIATVCAVEAALARPGTLLPLAGPLVFTAAGCALSASVASPPAWLALALVAATVCLLYRGRQVFTAIVMCLVIVGAVALTPTVAALGRPAPFDGRSLFPQPVRPLVDTSPLAQFAAIRSGRLPLSLRIEADAASGRMRYLSMDRFDGEYWTSVAHYRRAGHRLPEPPAEGEAWTIVEHVTIDRPGPLGWLPASGRPQEVSVADLGVDEQTGELVLPEGRPVPGQYTIRSRVQIWDPELLELATPASPPRERAFTVPADLAVEATRIVRGEFGHPALAQLATHFAQEGGYGAEDPAQSRSGHGLLHVRQLLESKRGTAEQYASSFAVLARALGYDTRVVVGFVPREEGSAYRVVGRDIDAWPEVRFTDLGWVPYYPTPGQRSGVAELPKPPAPQPEPTPSFSRAAVAPPAHDDTATGPRAAADDRIAYVATLSVVVVVVVAILLGAIPLAKVNRRRRRRRGDPNAQVLGAWRDTIDRFAEAGLAIPRSATPAEIALAAGDRFAKALANDALRLAALHDAAAYGPTAHGPTNATTAWRHATHVRRELRRSLRFGQRLRARLSPRPLLQRRHRSS
jgi:transglutaminase-like putative cysteine protease